MYCLFHLSVPAINGITNLICKEPTILKCDDGQEIVFTSIADSSFYGQNVSLECSARQECLININPNQCFGVTYYCSQS